MQQLVALEDVADVGSQPEDIDHINFTRLNSHYEPALRLARLILANLTLVDQRGSTTASSFLLDMNRLFERFVTEHACRLLGSHLRQDRHVVEHGGDVIDQGEQAGGHRSVFQG